MIGLDSFALGGIFLGFGVQDLVFDAEKKSVLHTEMAKKNLFVKRGQLSNLFLLGLSLMILSSQFFFLGSEISESVALCGYSSKEYLKFLVFITKTIFFEI